MNNIRTLFDRYSSEYDEVFNHTWLGQYYRNRIHKVFDDYLAEKTKIFELNAGTGEDAIYLARQGKQLTVTDISSSMLNVIEAKVKKEGLDGKVSLEQLDMQELGNYQQTEFGAIVSNFGGLNCINTWSEFARQSHRLLSADGLLIICLMGPLVPWEWLWFCLQGEFSKAFRRVNGCADWHGSKIYYPRITQFENNIKSQSFELLHRQALGVLMPPSYASAHVHKWQKTYKKIASLEERICTSKLACKLADHYLLVFRKK